MKTIEIEIYKYDELNNSQQEMAIIEAKMMFGSDYWENHDIEEHLRTSYYDGKGRHFSNIENIEKVKNKEDKTNNRTIILIAIIAFLLIMGHFLTGCATKLSRAPEGMQETIGVHRSKAIRITPEATNGPVLVGMNLEVKPLIKRYEH